MPEIMKCLNKISRAQGMFRAEMMKNGELCSHHHSFIIAICKNPGKSQEDIAKMLCLNKSTVARTISYLEEKGYVTRKQDLNDKRQFSVFPTDKMLDVFSEVIGISAKWNELISADIPDEELAVFFSVLSKIEANATEVIKEVSLNELG